MHLWGGKAKAQMQKANTSLRIMLALFNDLFFCKEQKGSCVRQSTKRQQRPAFGWGKVPGVQEKREFKKLQLQGWIHQEKVPRWLNWNMARFILSLVFFLPFSYFASS